MLGPTVYALISHQRLPHKTRIAPTTTGILSTPQSQTRRQRPTTSRHGPTAVRQMTRHPKKNRLQDASIGAATNEMDTQANRDRAVQWDPMSTHPSLTRCTSDSGAPAKAEDCVGFFQDSGSNDGCTRRAEANSKRLQERQNAR